MARRKKSDIVNEQKVENNVIEETVNVQEVINEESNKEDTVEENASNVENTEVAEVSDTVETSEEPIVFNFNKGDVGEEIVKTFEKEVKEEILAETKKAETIEKKVFVSPSKKAMEIINKRSRLGKFTKMLGSFIWNGQEFD